MKKFVSHLVCITLLLCAASVPAETKTFIREYTYEAGEMDSKVSCRAIALEQVKRLLLEELGTYVESTTVVRDNQIAKDEINALTAGIVQTTIMEENWNGKEYWLKAKIMADPDEVAASIDRLRNNEQLARDLAEARDEASRALQEVDALRQQLATAETNNDKREEYKQAVNTLVATDWFERGQYFAFSGNYQEAARAYDQVVVLRPNDAKAYSNRGAVYIQLGRYGSAAKDLDRAAFLNPRNKTTLFNRNLVYKKLQETRFARTQERDILRNRYDNRPQQGGNVPDYRINGGQNGERQRLLNRPSDRQLRERDEQLRKERQLVQRKRLEDKSKQRIRREDLKKKREAEQRKKKEKRIDKPRPRHEDEKGRN
ncbi:MAG TPA: tetratricopeptide repeat protein [Syntrophales bacterium]|nr:tetratricopeptide repeat protein [Syntrophales bacterium]